MIEAVFGEVAVADRFYAVARYEKAHAMSMTSIEEVSWCGRPLFAAERAPAGDASRCRECADAAAAYAQEPRTT